MNELKQVVSAYESWLLRQPLARNTQEAYRFHVRQYGEYLATRPSTGDNPLRHPFARDYAVRDYKRYLKTERKARPASVNLALAAIDHFYHFLGLDRVRVQREDLPQKAPRALKPEEQKAFLRAVERSPSLRDQALARLLFYTHPNNLPVHLTSLIGREQEVAAIQHLLHREDVRLLTLTGAGGIGKTRLGLQVAAELSDRFADGVFFVNLAPISDPALVIPTIAQALEVKEIAEPSLLDLLKASLRDKQLLLLLDNFEQVISAASQVTDLLASCPKLKIVVTSRAVLHVRGEQEFAAPPLAVPGPGHMSDLVALSQYEAVALFLARAQAVKPEFRLTTANARAVAEICVHLDGLPLAIELAAARIKLLPPQALLARLSQRLVVLTSGAKDAPVRQQTLRNTIAWSYDLLYAVEQRLFRRLSVFVGGCTLEAVEAVCAALDDSDGAGPILDGVASLIDKSLLQQIGQEELRLVMLETIREYGLEALEGSGEMEVTRGTHAAYYLAMAESAEPALDGPQQVMWLERLEREHDNLQAAMQWSLEQGKDELSTGEMALRLGGALWRFWRVHGHLSEGRNFLEQALAGSEGAVALVRAKALQAAADLALSQGDYEQGELLCEESLALYREHGDRRGVAFSLRLLVTVAGTRGNVTAARELAEESLALFKEVGDKRRVAWVLSHLAGLTITQGEYARGRALYEESLAMHRELGNKRGIADSLFNLAEVLFVSQGDPAPVHALLEESLVLFRELGHKQGNASSFNLLARLALSQGDTAMARSLLEKSVRLTREMGDRESTARSLSLLAKAQARQGEYEAARALSEESLALAREIGDKLTIAPFLEELAGVVAAQGELLWAARLWGAAESMRDTTGAPLPLVERTTYEQTVAAARAKLGKEAFAAAWAEGRTMTLEQALAAQGSVMIPQPTSETPQPLTSARVPRIYPAGLTAREVEVLLLVAQGLTDIQVAEQLVISPRTINWHLTSIYSKLGVSTRAAATRYAIEHKLV